MPEGDWCHFAQRISRTPLHRGVKAATLSYEDEKFSYVAATGFAARAGGARVLRHPQTRKGLVTLELCTPSGLQHRAVSRKDGLLYRRARDAVWGSTLDLPSEDR
jgi:ribosomal protein RSM22 (predicted rRNA methylase)